MNNRASFWRQVKTQKRSIPTVPSATAGVQASPRDYANMTQAEFNSLTGEMFNMRAWDNSIRETARHFCKGSFREYFEPFNKDATAIANAVFGSQSKRYPGLKPFYEKVVQRWLDSGMMEARWEKPI